MKKSSRLVFAFAVCMFSAGSAFAQESVPHPTPSPTNDEWVCGLQRPVVMKLIVSVWSNTRGEFINDLKYTDFELHDGKQVRDIDYFLKPSGEGTTVPEQNQYMLGFIIQDWEEKSPPAVNIRVKKPFQGSVIRVIPGGLIE